MNEATSMNEILRSVTEKAKGSDLDHYVGSGARLLEQRHKALQDARHGYSVGRAKIIADAARVLQQYDQQFRELEERIERDIQRLEIVKEALQ